MAQAGKPAIPYLDNPESVRLPGTDREPDDYVQEATPRPTAREISDCIIALSFDYYWETDPEHRISRVSFADPQTQRAASKVLLGKKRWESGTAPIAGDWAEHKAILDARERFRDFRIVLTEADGSVRYLSVSGMPRWAENGEFVGYMGITRDVTVEFQLQVISDLEVALMQLLAGTTYDRGVAASLKLICEKLNWKAARCWELDDSGVMLRLTHSTLPDDRPAQRVIAVGPADPVSKAHGIVASAWKDGQQTAGAWEFSEPLPEPGLREREAIAIPLEGRDGAFGVLEFRMGGYDYPKGRLSKFVSHLVAQIGVAHDRDHALEILTENEERFASTFELAAIGICHIAENGRLIHANARMTDMLGYSLAELLTKTVRDISHPDDRELTDDYIVQLSNREIDSFEIEKRYIRKDGEPVWVRIKSVMKWAASGEPLYHISVVEDISERKEAEARIEHMATHDDLTGLPNRTLFQELLGHSIESNARHGQSKCAVLFIDLDRFKVINDSLGHQAGDLLLKTAAERIRETLRRSDRVARFGGDEFVVLLNNIKHESDTETVAKKIGDALMAPIHLRDQECRVTASIGIAVCPDDGNDAQALLRNADVAMYAAKQSGKNTYQHFSVDMAPMSVATIRLESQLRHALERKEFRIQYQPKVDARNGEIIGVEALLRWWNAELGTIPPVQFVPIAEDTGLIIPIGRWVLHSACEQHVAWRERGLKPLNMSVNLSPKQFADPGLVGSVEATLDETGMEAGYLELEITEGMLMSNLERAIDTATELRKLGVRLAIDDFGTGYSSLLQLKRFPLDTLKIDRSFIRDLPTSTEDRAITEAIIAMGKTLGVAVVAEGIENEGQSSLLRELQCNQLQGFLFGKPSHPDEIVASLQQER